MENDNSVNHHPYTTTSRRSFMVHARQHMQCYLVQRHHWPRLVENVGLAALHKALQEAVMVGAEWLRPADGVVWWAGCVNITTAAASMHMCIRPGAYAEQRGVCGLRLPLYVSPHISMLTFLPSNEPFS